MTTKKTKTEKQVTAPQSAAIRAMSPIVFCCSIERRSAAEVMEQLEKELLAFDESERLKLETQKVKLYLMGIRV